MRHPNNVFSFSIAVVFAGITTANASELSATQKLIDDADARYASDCNTDRTLLIEVFDLLNQSADYKTNCSIELKQQYRYFALDEGYTKLLADNEFRRMASKLDPPTSDYANLDVSGYPVSKTSFSLMVGGDLNQISQPINTVRGYKTLTPGGEQ